MYVYGLYISSISLIFIITLITHISHFIDNLSKPLEVRLFYDYENRLSLTVPVSILMFSRLLKICFNDIHTADSLPFIVTSRTASFHRR